MKNSADSLNAPLKAPKTSEKISADIERDIIIKRHGIARILTTKETNEIRLKEYNMMGKSPSHTAKEPENNTAK